MKLNAHRFVLPLALFAGSFALIGQNSGIIVGPPQLTFSAQSNSGPVAPQNLVVSSSSGLVVNFTTSTFSGGNWLSVSPPSGSTPQALTVTANPGSLGAGTYGGFVTITTATGSTTVPVTLNVNPNGASPVTAAPSQLAFSFPTGSTVPQSQPVTIGSSTSSASAFTATTSTSNGGNWLSVTPNLGTTGSTLTVTVNPTSLNAGTYFGAVAINPPGSTGLVIPVQVSILSPSTLNISQQQLSFVYQTGTAAPAPQTLNLSTNGSGPISFSASAGASTCGNTWLVVSPQASATPSILTVQINPTGLQPGTCTGSIVISAPSASNSLQSIPVSLLVSNSPLLQVPTTGVTFNYQLGTAVPATQTVQVTSSSTALNYSVTATPLGNGPNFLTIQSGTGTTPQAITLAINPAVLNGLAPNTYAENVTISSPGAGNPAQSFTVTLVVSNNPMLLSTQQAVTFNYQIGQATPPSQLLTLSSTGAPLVYNVSSTTTTCNGFLTATPATASTPVQSGQQSQVVLAVTTSNLTTPQTCTGTVTISVPGSTTAPLTVPVTLNVSTTPLITLSPSVITVTTVAGSSAPVQRSIALTSTDGSTALNFTATASTNPPGLTWLSVAPNTGSAPASLSVIVNPSNLQAGVYVGSINVSSTAVNVGPQSVPVILTIATGTINVTPTLLMFSQPTGSPTPGSQTIQVGGVPAGATVGATATLFNGLNWLNVTSSGGTITVSPNGTQLAPGSYSGVVTIFVPGAANSPLNVPVTFTVGGAPLFAVSTSTVGFTYQTGGGLPASQTVQITSANGNVPFTAAVVGPQSPSTGPIFASVSPGSGTTPGSLVIALNQPVVSTLGPGTYTNLVNLTSSSAPGVNEAITVNLTVTMAGPSTITAVVNGASYLTGAVSPGEIVAIFGTNIGPATAVGLQLTASGSVSTTLGNTSVAFNGVQAPLIYVSANQINAIVPYEVAGMSSANVVVTLNGTSSASFAVNVVATAPAIFSSGQNGSGQGAILNEDLSSNSTTNAAARGSVIAIYATGEGVTIPAQATGSVTPSTGSSFPKPAVVTATIGGVPAIVTYFGEAPGLVAGVLQVNAIVPAGAAIGNQQVVLTVGGVSSPAVVTAAIK